MYDLTLPKNDIKEGTYYVMSTYVYRCVTLQEAVIVYDEGNDHLHLIESVLYRYFFE